MFRYNHVDFDHTAEGLRDEFRYLWDHATIKRMGCSLFELVQETTLMFWFGRGRNKLQLIPNTWAEVIMFTLDHGGDADLALYATDRLAYGIKMRANYEAYLKSGLTHHHYTVWRSGKEVDTRRLAQTKIKFARVG